MLKPVAVITCLEDSPPSFDRLLLGAYLRKIYKVVNFLILLRPFGCLYCPTIIF